MYSLRIIIVMMLSLILCVSAGCGPAHEMAGTHPRACGGYYLFEVSTINYAWGFVLNGFYIDREGRVFSFDHSDEKWMGPGGERWSRESLEEKYRNPILVGRVDRATLAEKCALIEDASKGKTTREQQGADMGSKSYGAFLYFPDTDEYKSVGLHTAGDWKIDNTSAAADSLVMWLESVERRFVTKDFSE